MKGPFYGQEQNIHGKGVKCAATLHTVQLYPKESRKKKAVIAGRPKVDSNWALTTHAMCTAPAAWYPEGTPWHSLCKNVTFELCSVQKPPVKATGNR